jgi:hypothetical protein
VDKCTVYVCGEEGLAQICIERKYCSPEREHPQGCKEYILIDPAEYAEFEKQAARVTELEQQVETLTAMYHRRGEAIVKLYDALVATFCYPEVCPLLRDDPARCHSCPCMLARLAAAEALTLSSDGVTKFVADARIGKAVREWHRKVSEWVEHAVYGNTQPRSLLTELAEVIEKARKGKADG